MNRLSSILTAGFFVVATGPALACDYPERPSIPDGSTASKGEMLAASSEVKAYLAGVDDYLICIESAEKDAVAELDSPEPAEIKRRDEMLGSKFDAANEEKALVGEEFNQQVRAYNAARQARQ